MWNYVSFASGKFLVLVTTAVLARLLTPQEFGIVAFATVAVNWLGVLKDLGLGGAVIQRRDDTEEAAQTAYVLNLGVSVLLTAGTVLAAPAVASFFREPLVVPILRVLSFTFLIQALGVDPRRAAAAQPRLPPQAGARRRPGRDQGHRLDRLRRRRLRRLVPGLGPADRGPRLVAPGLGGHPLEAPLPPAPPPGAPPDALRHAPADHRHPGGDLVEPGLRDRRPHARRHRPGRLHPGLPPARDADPVGVAGAGRRPSSPSSPASSSSPTCSARASWPRSATPRSWSCRCAWACSSPPGRRWRCSSASNGAGRSPCCACWRCSPWWARSGSTSATSTRRSAAPTSWPSWPSWNWCCSPRPSSSGARHGLIGVGAAHAVVASIDTTIRLTVARRFVGRHLPRHRPPVAALPGGRGRPGASWPPGPCGPPRPPGQPPPWPPPWSPAPPPTCAVLYRVDREAVRRLAGWAGPAAPGRRPRRRPG